MSIDKRYCPVALGILILLGLTLVVARVVVGIVTAPSLDWWLQSLGGVTKDGTILKRRGPETIRLSWGTVSGVSISAANSLEWWGLSFGMWDEIFDWDEISDTEDVDVPTFPPLAPYEGVWMFDVAEKGIEHYNSVTACSFINPKLSKAEKRMFRIKELVETEPVDWEAVTRLAAENFTYLGWVVRNESDISALKEALTDRAEVDLSADLRTPHGVLYRLREGVERQFVSDVNVHDALEKARSEIPVMFECLNAEAGHPCDAMHVLYLDGRIERIPFGQRFPATQTFVDAFPPPAR